VAAAIIGGHFVDVKDKLLNILQLNSESNAAESKALIQASIQQKSSEIKLVPFTNAVDLTSNRKYLKYALPPLLVLLALFLGSPGIIKDSTKRLSNPTQFYEKQAPFVFNVEHPKKVIQYQNATIKVRLTGQVLPSEVYIQKDGKPFKMTAEKRDEFSYTFKNINEAFGFNVSANGFSSKPYKVALIPKPTLLDAQVQLKFPAYTGKSPEVVRNVGEINVPIGTIATWKFNAKHTSDVAIHEEIIESKKGFFKYTANLMQAQVFQFMLSNDELKDADSIHYQIGIIPDQYPTISAEKITDSTDAEYIYFVGEYTDDYGVSDLRFHFKLIRYDRAEADSFGTERLTFDKNATIGRYAHFTNAGLYHLSPGDQLEFHFEVKDNDGINGAKSSRSEVFTYKKPTVKEYKEQEDENIAEVKDDLSKALEKVDDIAKQVKDIKEKSLEKKSLEWNDKKKLEDLLKQHEELAKSLEQMQQTFEENLKNQDEFKKTDEDILEKQQRIEELMEELLTDEMKEMMEKLREMMEEMEMNQAFEEMEDFEMSAEDLAEKLDRILELFKKLEFEQKMEDVANELEALAEEQLELSKETEEGKNSSEDLLEKQEAINEKFEELKKEMEALNEKNEEQKSPADLSEINEDAKKTEQDMQEGTEELKNDKQKKAAPKQNSAGEKMKQMAQNMKNMMQSMEMAQSAEDLEQLRQLLENLVKLSFDQEALFEEVKLTNTDQPRFRELVQEQYKLNADVELIEDSLVALSKRVFQLESFQCLKYFLYMCS